MKILVMTSYYPPHFHGGAELTCQSHVEGLEKRKHNVSILTSYWGIPERAIEKNVNRLLNYDKTNLDFAQDQEPSDPFRFRRRYAQFRRAFSLGKNYSICREVINVLKPDVAYIWHMHAVSISPVLAAQDFGIPIVFRLPDYWLAQIRKEICQEPHPLKRWYRSLLNGFGSFHRLDTTHMLPNSRAVMQRYLEAGFSADSMQVIPNGLPKNLLIKDNDLFDHPRFVKGRAIRLLFAGRLEGLKGPDIAILALAHLKNELGFNHVTLDIIGEGSNKFKRELQSLVVFWGLEDSVSFVGRIDHADMIERYTEYDVLLLTSRWEEPFSRSMLEAMGRGLPVVATNTGGTSEVICDGNNGLLVPPDNPVAMAMAVKKLLTEPELVQKIRRNALEVVHTKYSLEHIIDQVDDYFQKLIIHESIN